MINKQRVQEVHNYEDLIRIVRVMNKVVVKIADERDLWMRRAYVLGQGNSDEYWEFVDVIANEQEI